MSYWTIFLFIVYSWGLGYSLTRFVKNSDNILERNLMRIGIGLGTIPLIGVILSILHIPIDWKIILVLSIIIPLFHLIKNLNKFRIPIIKITKSNIIIFIVLILLVFTLFMYTKGAFFYPYLEDEDPWEHALSVKYVSVEKNLRDPLPDIRVLQYIDPYPPGYAVLFGILHQTSPSLNWTLKFFNALIISLGIMFFYFFAREFIGNKNKALFATFVLASIPCYLSHFIWAHSYVVTLFFPAMYCLERIKHDKKWSYISAVVISSLIMIQPTQPMKLGALMGIYFLIKCIKKKKILKHLLIALVLGALLSLLWWGPHLIGFFHHADKAASSKGLFAPNSGTATRPYTFNDFFVAKKQNMINNPLGVGIVLSLLLIFTIFFLIINYKKLQTWEIITLFWLAFTFIGINSMTFNLPIGLYAFRFWMLFAIPVSLISAEGASILSNMLKKIGIGNIITIVVLIVGIIFTSGIQKYAVNTAIWPPGSLWSSMDELQGYLSLQNLPTDEKVFPVCKTGPRKSLGFDKLVYFWRGEGAEKKPYDERIDLEMDELSSWLKSHGYKYLIMDGTCAKEKYMGINKTNEKINELISSPLFQPVHQTNGFILFQVI